MEGGGLLLQDSIKGTRVLRARSAVELGEVREGLGRLI